MPSARGVLRTLFRSTNIWARYPLLFSKLIQFTTLNVILQAVPLGISYLSSGATGHPFRPSLSEIITLISFSWIALPSFMDKFPWSSSRKTVYSWVAYCFGVSLLCAAIAARGVHEFLNTICRPKCDSTSSRLFGHLKGFEAVHGNAVGWTIIIVAVLLLYVALYLGHTRLLYRLGLRLRWYHQAQFAGFYVAKQRGFFEGAGLDVVIRERDVESTVIQRLSSKEDEFGVLMAAEVVQFVEQGFDLVAVEVLSVLSPHELLINRLAIDEKKKTGSSIRVLSVRNCVETDLVRVLLREHGLADVELEINYYSDNHGVEEFLQGRYDVVVVHRANEKIYLQRKLKMENWVATAIVNPEKFDLYLLGETLVTSAGFSKDHPVVVEAMRRATIEGWNYAGSHQTYAAKLSYEQARLAHRQSAHHLGDGGLPHQQAMLSEMIHMYNRGHDLRGRQSESLWQKVIDSCRRAGLIPQDAKVSPGRIVNP